MVSYVARFSSAILDYQKIAKTIAVTIFITERKQSFSFQSYFWKLLIGVMKIVIMIIMVIMIVVIKLVVYVARFLLKIIKVSQKEWQNRCCYHLHHRTEAIFEFSVQFLKTFNWSDISEIGVLPIWKDKNGPEL